jgi:UDP-N-acetylmuramate dehydrogenase
LNIQQHISLLPYNTFGIDVNAASFIEINSLSDLQAAVVDGIFKGKHLILGGGSNMLLGADFDGTVLKNNLKGIEILKQDADYVWIKAAGGEVWHQLVMYCVDNGYGGIENMSLIPGTVGAAPMQNIGAYGVELTDVFYELTAIDILTGELRLFSHFECHFGYRSSVFKTTEKGRYFITDVTLRLSKHPEVKISYGAIKDVLAEKGQIRPTIKDVSDAVIAIRSSKLPDPKVLGNAGSFFKNPEIPEEQYTNLKQTFPAIPGYPAPQGLIKVPAGWLIEQCGWKGKRVGNTGAHKDQALVLVNYGGATGAEIMQLAAQIQQSVLEKFNISITPEVNLIT